MGKKITILGSAYPFRGGLASYNERLCKEFNHLGHEAVIVTFKLQYPKLLFPGKTQYSSSPAPTNLEIRRAVNSINPLNWIKVGRQIKKSRPDILIIKYWLPFMSPCLSTIARITKKNKHTKVITIIDNIIPHEKRIGDIQFSKYFARSVDAFLTMSDAVDSDLNRFDRIKPRVQSPHPLFDNFGKSISKEEARNQLDIDNRGKYILFFGFIRDYKGLDLLLEAMSNTHIREKNIKAIIAGEFYSNEEKYQKIINDLGIKDQLKQHHKFINDEDVAKYFCAADVIVQPYKSATQSGVTQIAYHFNKPMIVTNVGGLPELVPDGQAGYVREPKSDQIADAILKFYNEASEEEMVSEVKQLKKRFSWEILVGRILDLYNEIVSK